MFLAGLVGRVFPPVMKAPIREDSLVAVERLLVGGSSVDVDGALVDVRPSLTSKLQLGHTDFLFSH